MPVGVGAVPWGRLGTVMTAGALAATLTACGGSGGSESGSSGGSASANGGDATAAVKVAPARTIDAKNAKVDLNGNSDASGRAGRFSGNGGIDFVNNATDLAVTVPGEGRSELRQIGNASYAKIPSSVAAQFGGKTWLRVDPSLLAVLGGANPFGGLSNSTPTTYIDALKGATNATKVGDETVTGAHTVHYRTTVDIAAAPGLTDEQKQQLQRAFGGQNSVPEDVWIDDAGRVAQLAVDTTATPRTVGADSTTTIKTHVQLTLHDWGSFTTPVTAPPADQVGDLGQLLGQLGQLGPLFGSGSGGSG